MISPVSFTSTYKVNNRNPELLEKFAYLARYVKLTNVKDKANFFYSDKIETSGEETKYISELTLMAPDKADESIEEYCAKHDIKYKKYCNKPESIIARIKPAPEGHRLAFVNTEKLENLISTQSSNFNSVQNKYNGISYKIDATVKSKDEFPTTTLVINPLADYDEIDTEDFTNNRMLVDFCQSQSGDSFEPLIYFALKEAGIKKVPVYVNDETHMVGTLLGLFE